MKNFSVISTEYCHCWYHIINYLAERDLYVLSVTSQKIYFWFKSGLEKKFITYEEKHPYSCRACFERYQTLPELRSHQTVGCVAVKVLFTFSHLLLKTSWNPVGPAEYYRCSVCLHMDANGYIVQKLFNKKYKLQQHLHFEHEQVECGECHTHIYGYRMYKLHCKALHAEALHSPRYTCSICFIPIRTRRQKKVHLLSHFKKVDKLWEQRMYISYILHS